MQPQDRISDAYLEQQRTLHANPNYGVASMLWAPIVHEIVSHFRPGSLCDYGAGKRRLEEELRRLGSLPPHYYPYDPAFPEYGEPRPAEMVCCIDVLEHVEPEYLDAVLAELANLTRRLGFFTVHTGPAKKTLPDGRNAHLIQRPTSWWLPRLCRHFEIDRLAPAQGGFWVLVAPQAKPL